MATVTTPYSGPSTADLDQIPAALKALHQWVLWRGADRVNEKTGEIKLNKIPICPQTLTNADSTDPLTWGTFAQCVAALPCALEEWEEEAGPAYRGGGLGFVFTEMDSYCGIDLDGCVDPDTGTIAAWAQTHVHALASYTEVTPSGTGLHILVQGDLPQHGRKKGNIENYSYARFFTMTGWHVPGTPRAIEDRAAALAAFHKTIFGEARPRQDHATSGVATLDDTALLTRAEAAKNSARFIALYAGNWEGYSSQSEADMSLCVRLAFWTQDPAQIDRLFRQSGLMRDKWDERRGQQTYGARTVTEALARQTEHYHGPSESYQQRNGQGPGPEPAPQPSLADAVVSYAELQTLDIPKREVYLDWLSERSLVMVYGPRGVGKTMTMLGIAVSLTTGRPFLKWPVQCPCGVLYVEGEMSVDELRDRARLMAGGTEPHCLAFLPSELVQARLDRDLTLVCAAARQEIDAMLAARPALRVLVLDNISCLFPGISEDKKQDWEPINQWLIRLRHRGVTVILGHHAGKGGRQRGTSGREDVLNTVLALTLPPGYKPEEGCHFYLRFEKSRGLKGPSVEGLDVRFDETPDGPGWTYQALEVERTERLKLMLADGVPPRIIAEELGVSASYVYRQKRYLGL